PKLYVPLRGRKMKITEELFTEAKNLLPGGTNDPSIITQPNPIYVRRGKGAYIWDLEDNKYIDYDLAFGSMILGHAHPYIEYRIRAILEDGIQFGASVPYEIELARKLKKHIPTMEMMRFTPSYSEAAMHAIRLARAYTKKDKIIKIEGGHHGSYDQFLAKSGSGMLTHATLGVHGILKDVAMSTVTVPFNDIKTLKNTIRENEDMLAAMIIEPIPTSMGTVLPKEDYLKTVRELANAHNFVLIFDETSTAFRLSLGCVYERFGVKPDLIVLGKIVGGGFPLGVFGGKKELMEMLAPVGKVYQSSNLYASPLILGAGVATLDFLETNNVHERLNRLGDNLRTRLTEVIQKKGLKCRVQGLGSMFTIFMTEKEVTNCADVRMSNIGKYMDMYYMFLKEGIYIPSSQFETAYLSAAHTEEEVDKTVEAFNKVMN
ncbi:MAG: glutamate-1-semialdehyde 2,1-aminomutase, partial [Thermoplasmata archaeon]